MINDTIVKIFTKGRLVYRYAREIKGFPSYYITTEGIVFNKDNIPVKPEILHRGHYRVSLWKGKKKYRIMIHRLVLETFVGKAPKGKPFTRHLNGNPADNRISNLRWGSHKDNKADSFRHGTVALGENNGKSILNSEVVKVIKYAYFKMGKAQYEIARILGLKKHLIFQIVREKSWRHITV